MKVTAVAQGRFHVQVGVWQMGMCALGWWLAGIPTLGIAWYYAPYKIARRYLDGLEIRDDTGARIGTLKVSQRFGANTRHIIGWWLLTVCIGIIAFLIFPFAASVAGIVWLFYPFAIIKKMLDSTYLD